MDAKDLQRLRSLYDRGILTPMEFADGWIADCAFSGKRHDLREMFGLLPVEIQREVVRQLNDMRDEGFVWKPFLMGTAAVSTPETVERLRRTWELLASNKGEEEPPPKASTS